MWSCEPAGPGAECREERRLHGIGSRIRVMERGVGAWAVEGRGKRKGRRPAGQVPIVNGKSAQRQLSKAGGPPGGETPWLNPSSLRIWKDAA